MSRLFFFEKKNQKTFARFPGPLHPPVKRIKSFCFFFFRKRRILCFFLLAFFCFAGPTVWPQDPAALDPSIPLSPPTPAHPLGTDELGRDMLARLMSGGANSLAIAIPAAALALALGAAWGLAAGLGPWWLDLVLMRAVDILLALPALIVLMAASALPGFVPSPAALALLIALVAWPATARLVRQETRALCHREFVLAAQQLGAGTIAVARWHILPALRPLLAANAAFLLGDAILALSTLSFLGLGIRPPQASWGGLLAAGLGYVDVGAWWLIAPPALLIFVSLLLAGARFR